MLRSQFGLDTIPIVPQRWYRNAPAAIAFLERAFGFQPGLVVNGDGDETIVHAELWHGRGCLMMASLDDSEAAKFTSPVQTGDNTGVPYVATPDLDALYARAKAANCEIVSPLAATDYGSHDFSARDCERFLWNFGSYRPQQEPPGSDAPASWEPELFAGLRYEDATAAIAWLCTAFGASEQFVVSGPGNTIAHAELRLSGEVFMLGSGRNDEFALKTPSQLDGISTQMLNVYVADPDAHCARATASGAFIVRELTDTAYDTRGYVVRDCEGYVWHFSTYRPQRPSVLP